MNPTVVIIAAMIFGILPLVICSILSIRQWTFGLWLFSPLPTFIFAYAMAFGFVPFVEATFGLKIYPTITVDEQSFLIAEGLGVLSCWAFAAGFLIYSRRFGRLSEADQGAQMSPDILKRALIQQKTLFILTLAMQIVFAAYLVSVHAFTLNFAQNRLLYLDSLLGSGYINLIDQLASNLLMIGLLFSLWTRRIGKLGFLTLVTFILVNFIITNRGIITSLFYLLIFTYFLRNYRNAVKIKPIRLIAMLGVIISLGAVIGLSRGIGAVDVPDDPDSPTQQAIKTFPPLISGAIFLSYTFDMGVLLEKTVQNNDPWEWGSTWYEDVVLTFLPRALFPDKPVLFGATRLQNQVAPEIYGGEVNVSATFPIGIFGEAYANFGIPGVVIILFLLGLSLKYWYSRCLQLAQDASPRWVSLCFTVMYATICSSSLPYIRSFGGFISIILFMAMLLFASAIFVQFISQVFMPKIRKELTEHGTSHVSQTT